MSLFIELDFERGIWAAARDGEEDRVRELLKKGTHPSQKDSSGYTALHYASRAGHMDVVQVYHNEIYSWDTCEVLYHTRA